MIVTIKVSDEEAVILPVPDYAKVEVWFNGERGYVARFQPLLGGFHWKIDRVTSQGFVTDHEGMIPEKPRGRPRPDFDPQLDYPERRS